MAAVGLLWGTNIFLHSDLWNLFLRQGGCFRHCFSVSNFTRKVGNGPMNEWLNFGGNPNHQSGYGSGSPPKFKKPALVEVCTVQALLILNKFGWVQYQNAVLCVIVDCCLRLVWACTHTTTRVLPWTGLGELPSPVYLVFYPSRNYSAITYETSVMYVNVSLSIYLEHRRWNTEKRNLLNHAGVQQGKFRYCDRISYSFVMFAVFVLFMCCAEGALNVWVDSYWLL